MSSLWTPDGSLYLTDLRHPLIAEEHRRQLVESGRRFDEYMSPAERRQFDRDMVAKYGKAYPPPARTEWALITYDIMDAAEERAARTTSKIETVTVYVDEDLFEMKGVTADAGGVAV